MDTKDKTFSVVLTTYNRRKKISDSLESIANQGYRNLEIILVDDGSTDGTDEFIKTVSDPRLRYIKLPTNQGASAARNRGIQEAKGDFILVWDSDDVLYPNALEKILAVFEKYPAYAIVSAPARVLTDGKEVQFPRFPQGEATLVDILLKKLPSNEKVRVAKTSVMKQVSYKSRNIDFLVNVELIERGKWYHLDEFLGDVFNDPEQGSLTALRKKRNAMRSVERAPYLVDFLRRHGKYLKKISPTRYADHCFGAAIGFLLSGEKKNARHFAWQAVCSRPFKISYWALWKLCWFPGGSAVLRALY